MQENDFIKQAGIKLDGEDRCTRNYLLNTVKELGEKKAKPVLQAFKYYPKSTTKKSQFLQAMLRAHNSLGKDLTKLDRQDIKELDYWLCNETVRGKKGYGAETERLQWAMLKEFFRVHEINNGMADFRFGCFAGFWRGE